MRASRDAPVDKIGASKLADPSVAPKAGSRCLIYFHAMSN